MAPEEITVRYRWTFEALVEATRGRFRELGWWQAAGALWCLVAIGLA